MFKLRISHFSLFVLLLVIVSLSACGQTNATTNTSAHNYRSPDSYPNSRSDEATPVASYSRRSPDSYPNSRGDEITLINNAQTRNLLPTGTYSLTVIPTDIASDFDDAAARTTVGQYLGNWQLELAKDGYYFLSRNDRLVFSGSYTVTPEIITFSSPLELANCNKAEYPTTCEGSYSWHFDGISLRLTAQSDTISIRNRVLASHPLPYFGKY